MHTRGVNQALRGITSATYRRRVREAYKRRGGQTRPFHRELLARKREVSPERRAALTEQLRRVRTGRG